MRGAVWTTTWHWSLHNLAHDRRDRRNRPHRGAVDQRGVDRLPGRVVKSGAVMNR
jgi:hypothetical protein